MCENLIKEKGMRCKAFPDGIPSEVVLNRKKEGEICNQGIGYKKAELNQYYSQLALVNTLPYNIYIGNDFMIRVKDMNEYYWYPCPHCGKKKMQKLRKDTKLINFPAYCKWCKQETLITLYEPPRQEAN